MGGGWIILRTSGRCTMRLAETLTEDGYDAWTPIETRNVRIPRANVRRTIKLPIMPSYVFVRARYLIDLIQLSGMKPIPRRVCDRPADRSDEWRPFHSDFSVMRFNESIPVIDDRHLQSLREIEVKRTPKKKSNHKFLPGVDVRVKIEGGSFAGMKGRVEKSDHGDTLVCFDGRLTVKISTSLLTLDEVGSNLQAVGLAA